MTDLPGLLLLGLRFGLAICLYLFLFWALRILWKSLKASAVNEDQMLPPLTLSISKQEDTSSYTLVTTENLIGRASECTVQLEDTTVSNLHARIYFNQSQWWIEDLDSSNGTYLNGDKLEQPTVLTDQDHLELGSLNGIIQIPPQTTTRS